MLHSLAKEADTYMRYPAKKSNNNNNNTSHHAQRLHKDVDSSSDSLSIQTPPPPPSSSPTSRLPSWLFSPPDIIYYLARCSDLSLFMWVFIVRWVLVLYMLWSRRVLPLFFGLPSTSLTFDSCELLYDDQRFPEGQNWDAVHYYHIAKHGYSHENLMVFFPFIPCMIRAVSYVVTVLVPVLHTLAPVSMYLSLINIGVSGIAAVLLRRLTILTFLGPESLSLLRRWEYGRNIADDQERGLPPFRTGTSFSSSASNSGGSRCGKGEGGKQRWSLEEYAQTSFALRLCYCGIGTMLDQSHFYCIGTNASIPTSPIYSHSSSASFGSEESLPSSSKLYAGEARRKVAATAGEYHTRWRVVGAVVLLWVITPAMVFTVVVYTESFFSLFCFLGIYCLAYYSPTPAASVFPSSSGSQAGMSDGGKVSGRDNCERKTAAEGEQYKREKEEGRSRARLRVRRRSTHKLSTFLCPLPSEVTTKSSFITHAQLRARTANTVSSSGDDNDLDEVKEEREVLSEEGFALHWETTYINAREATAVACFFAAATIRSNGFVCAGFLLYPTFVQLFFPDLYRHRWRIIHAHYWSQQQQQQEQLAAAARTARTNENEGYMGDDNQRKSGHSSLSLLNGARIRTLYPLRRWPHPFRVLVLVLECVIILAPYCTMNYLGWVRYVPLWPLSDQADIGAKFWKFYAILQKKYWNVGFFTAYTISNSPNILLALPIGGLIVFMTWKFYVQPIWQLWDKGKSYSSDVTPVSPDVMAEKRTLYHLIELMVKSSNVVYLCALCIIAFTVMHIQVANRFVMSSPALYWLVSAQLVSEPRNLLTSAVLMWMITWSIIGGFLFANHLPWT